MKSVNIAKLTNELSSHIRAVERGAAFVVTDRDRPVAQLVPVADEDGFELITGTKPFSVARKRKPKPTRLPLDSLALLLEERGKR